MVKEIKDLVVADLVGKQVTSLVVSTKYVREKKLKALWDKILPIAKPIGGIRGQSVWCDFKSNNAKDLVEWLNFNKYNILKMTIH
jgi:hypothetical protein